MRESAYWQRSQGLGSNCLYDRKICESDSALGKALQTTNITNGKPILSRVASFHKIFMPGKIMLVTSEVNFTKDICYYCLVVASRILIFHMGWS